MATFDQQAITSLVSYMASVAMKLGTFKSVNLHEPKSAPGNGLRLAIWADSIDPIAAGSGLDATTGYVVMSAQAYSNMMQKPEDGVDTALMASASVLLGAYSADFTLGGHARNIDLLGAYGQTLRAQAGYVSISQVTYRVMTVTIPCVINDLWTQASGL